MPATLNLLPRKEFEITLEDKTVIRGQYGTWALKRFCDKRSLSLKQAGEVLGDPSLSDVSEYVMAAVEHCYAKKSVECLYTDVDVCDWIDQLGGVQSELFVKLFSHSADENFNEDSDTEKKRETQPTEATV